MVNKQDLRLGNYLMFDGRYIQVTSLHDEYLGWGLGENWTARAYSDKNIQPILLTADVLAKCGFETHDTDYGVEYNLNGMIISNEFELISWSYLDRSVISNPLEYLHQLQNLTHALSGKELEFEL